MEIRPKIVGSVELFRCIGYGTLCDLLFQGICIEQLLKRGKKSFITRLSIDKLRFIGYIQYILKGVNEMNDESIRFIESWGSMGVFWGINRSMARIHAYILLSEDPVDLDTVSNFLNISRGNASMCLKELRNWRVIKRQHQSGDRKDYYVSEPDMWKMFFLITSERKKREFDPAQESLQEVIASGDLDQDSKVIKRLKRMEDIFNTFNRLGEKFLESEKKSKNMLSFVKSMMSI